MPERRNGHQVPARASEITAEAASLSDLAEQANAAHADVEKFIGMAAKRAIDAGRALNCAERQMKFGEWLPWLKANFRATERLAQKYMLMATLADYVPDALEGIEELTINSALDALREAYVARVSARAETAATFTAEIVRLLRSYGRLIDEARNNLGEAHWRAWLASLGITEAAALTFISAAELLTINGAKAAVVLVPLPDEVRAAIFEEEQRLFRERRQRQLAEDRQKQAAKAPNTNRVRISRKSILRAENERARLHEECERAQDEERSSLRLARSADTKKAPGRGDPAGQGQTELTRKSDPSGTKVVRKSHAPREVVALNSHGVSAARE